MMRAYRRVMHRFLSFRSPFAAILVGLLTVGSLVGVIAPRSAMAVEPVPKSCPEQETQVAVFNDGRRGAQITVYAAPSSAAKPVARIKAGINTFGRVVFRLLGTEGDFYKVMAPARPNGLTGYIQKSLATTYATPYSVEISLSAKTLRVKECGAELFSAAVAVGKTKTPTPTGSFFLVDLLRPKGGSNGAYGPFAFGLSGYSKVLQKFGAGDGRVGIHGTNQPSLIGTAVSSGCIRIDNATITKMADTLFLGSPVTITP